MGGKETPVEGFDGKNGYAMNYAQNKLQQYTDYIPENFDNDFIDWENKGFEAELLGKEKIGEQYYFKVELTKNVNKTIYFFDVKNYMLYREIKKDEILTYSDYRKVGQLLMPYRIESSSPESSSMEASYSGIYTSLTSIFPVVTFEIIFVFNIPINCS